MSLKAANLVPSEAKRGVISKPGNPHLSQSGAEGQLPGGEGTEEEAHRPGGEDQDGRGVGDPRWSFDDFFSLELCLKIGFKKWLDHPWSEFPWEYDTIWYNMSIW